MNAMDSLEEKIAYQFTDPQLLNQAMTHPSVAYESQQPQFDNQRLEFLGDAVLQLILTDELYRLFPDFAEGRLTKLRARLVSGVALKKFALDLDLGTHLQMGRGEENSGGRERRSNLADAFESLIGAIYLDGGMENATRVVLACCSGAIDEVAREPEEEKNPKGELQETLQAISPISPTYRVIDESGPAHDRTFTISVEWEDRRLGEGVGSSKKLAEIEAARVALEKKLWI